MNTVFTLNVTHKTVETEWTENKYSINKFFSCVCSRMGKQTRIRSFKCTLWPAWPCYSTGHLYFNGLASSTGHLQMALSSTNLLRPLIFSSKKEFLLILFSHRSSSIEFSIQYFFGALELSIMYHAHDQLTVIFWIYLTTPCPSNNSQSSSLFFSLHLKLFSNSCPRFFLVFSFHILLDCLLMTQ